MAGDLEGVHEVGFMRAGKLIEPTRGGGKVRIKSRRFKEDVPSLVLKNEYTYGVFETDM